MIAFILQIEDDAGRKLMIEIYRHYFRLIKKHMSNAIPADDVEDCIQDCFVRLTANVQQLKNWIPHRLQYTSCARFKASSWIIKRRKNY